MVLVDGHVHVHECFDVGRLFDAAAANFAAAASALKGGRGSATALGAAAPRASARAHDAVLCLVESRGERFLAAVRAGRDRVWRGDHGYWEIELGPEPETCVARRGGTRLTLIAGRQIVTSERLEVLALGTTAPFPDGVAIEATLAAVRDAGAA
ncbi:MAG TPA: hypothetical protein VFL84_00925, partial [Gammaproteobacteria bacterium]|nr:hypothetical protein [Gammaproteobacteria bacterium]